MTLDEVGQSCERDPAHDAARERLTERRARVQAPVVVVLLGCAQQPVGPLAGVDIDPVELAIRVRRDEREELRAPARDERQRVGRHLDLLPFPGDAREALHADVRARAEPDRHRLTTARDAQVASASGMSCADTPASSGAVRSSPISDAGPSRPRLARPLATV